MTTPSPPLVASRLEKAATDNGFDVPRGREGDGLAFANSQTSLRVWLATFGRALYLVALSQLRVAGELSELGTPLASSLPQGAGAVRRCSSGARKRGVGLGCRPPDFPPAARSEPLLRR